jgi:hypothetical protein
MSHNQSAIHPSGAGLKHKVHRLIAIGLVAAGIVSSFSANADSGRALDWATHEPVAGARMTLDCARYKLIGLEGSTHLRTVTNVTDAEGRYSFWHLDLLGCDLVTFGGEKEVIAAPCLTWRLKNPTFPPSYT